MQGKHAGSQIGKENTPVEYKVGSIKVKPKVKGKVLNEKTVSQIMQIADKNTAFGYLS